MAIRKGQRKAGRKPSKKHKPKGPPPKKQSPKKLGVTVKLRKVFSEFATTPPEARVETNKELVREVRDYVRKLKTEFNTCVDCDVQYPPYVLEFDHVDPKTKLFNVGNASSAPSMEALIAECDKCDVVCSNCHKTREYKRKYPKKERGPVV